MNRIYQFNPWLERFLSSESPSVIPPEVAPPEHYRKTGAVAIAVKKFLKDYGLVEYTVDRFLAASHSELKLEPESLPTEWVTGYRARSEASTTQWSATNYSERWFGSKGDGSTAVDLHVQAFDETEFTRFQIRDGMPQRRQGRLGIPGARNFPFVIKVFFASHSSDKQHVIHRIGIEIYSTAHLT